jgi:hypothetical protein
LILINDEVWVAWQAAVDHNPGEPLLMLLFSPDGDRAAAVRGVRESVMEVWDALDQSIWASQDRERSAGEWGWLGVPGGVLVQVSECDMFEEMLRRVAAALEQRGVAGSFDEAQELPLGVDTPASAHTLACRGRLRGWRRKNDYGYYWEHDPDAHAQFVSAAQRWCKQLGRSASYALSKGTIARVPIEFGDDVLDGLLEGPVDNLNTRLVAVSGDGFRAVRFRPTGAVALVAGGREIEQGHWRPALDELMGFLRDNAELLAYAYIRRGWAGIGPHDPVGNIDWPPRAGAEPRGAGWTSEAFEDVFAPDALAVQFLGAGYAGRAPESPSYRQTPAGDGGTLLEHVDLAAWFDAPFVPRGERSDPDEQAPRVLAKARRELAPILYTPGALNRAGYVDAPDL